MEIFFNIKYRFFKVAADHYSASDFTAAVIRLPASFRKNHRRNIGSGMDRAYHSAAKPRIDLHKHQPAAFKVTQILQGHGSAQSETLYSLT